MILASNTTPPRDEIPSDPDLQYFSGIRTQIDMFVTRQFKLRGTLDLHKAAIGWDILRAPINVILSPVLVTIRLLALLCRIVRLKRAGAWLRTRRILLRTDVASCVETSVVRDLLKIPLPNGNAHSSAELSRAILAAPQFRDTFRSRSNVSEINALAERIAATIAEYSSARSAISDITTAIIAVFIGALVFQTVTPGMISIAPKLANTIAFETAVANFPLGQTAGSFWYNSFSPNTSPWLVAVNVAGLLMLGSIIGAFAGIIADPVQSRLGIHRRRLLKFIDAVEDDVAGSGGTGYVAREHFYARFMDIWDVGISAIRFFRS